MINRVRYRVGGALGLGVLMLVAFTASLRGQGLELFGYGDLEWTAEDRGDEWHNFFDNHHFNLIALGWIIEDVTVGVEIEYEHAGNEVAVEYAYLSYGGIPHLRITGGKFIIPFNRWNKDLHPTWISKVPGRPLVYSNVFPSTYADVGLWFSGGVSLSTEGARFTYDAYVVNGLECEADESDWRGCRGNDRERPRRGSGKGFGGRLGLEFPFGLGLGVSGYTDEYAEDELTEEGLDFGFFGADADYRYRQLELRGELVLANQDLSEGAGDNDRSGFYLQGAYEVVPNFEPVIRYSWVDFEEVSSDTQELGIGFSYYMSASVMVRLTYFFKTERNEEFEKDNDKLMGQFVVNF